MKTTLFPIGLSLVHFHFMFMFVLLILPGRNTLAWNKLPSHSTRTW